MKREHDLFILMIGRTPRDTLIESKTLFRYRERKRERERERESESEKARQRGRERKRE